MAIENYLIERVINKMNGYPFLCEVVSSVEVYLGFEWKKDSGKYHIRRLSEVDGIAREEFAGEDENDFSLDWDLRTTYFEQLPNTLTNTHSLSFNGIDEEIKCGDVHIFESSTAWSIGLWVKPNNLAAQRCIFSKASADTSVHGYMIYHDNAGKLFIQMRGSVDRLFTFQSTLSAGVWQSIMITYQGNSNINGIRAYINGVVENTPTSGSLGTMMYGQDFCIGSRNGSFEFSGNLNNMLVFNKELSQAEVTEWHNGGKAIKPTEHSAYANVLSHYRLGNGDTPPDAFDSEGSADGTMFNMDSSNVVEDAP